jgi:hypothetical protein
MFLPMAAAAFQDEARMKIKREPKRALEWRDGEQSGMAVREKNVRKIAAPTPASTGKIPQ